ncbi:MAG: aminotransferase class V-fold PLP-dependent enzyme, partial [Planctomycetota bacterium]
LTTIVAIVLLTWTQIPGPSPIGLCLFFYVYLAAEVAIFSKVAVARSVSYVFSLLLFALMLTAFGFDILQTIGIRRTTPGQVSLLLLALIFGIHCGPALWEYWLRASPRVHRLAVWFTRGILSIGSPESQIRTALPIQLWRFDRGVTFLNHGSFGAVPLAIRDQQDRWRQECMNQPMEFLARRHDRLAADHRFWLATRLGTKPENIAFCDNATAGMNEIARWFPLAKGDEVLMNDHEYGAVRRIWERRCQESGAKLVTASLPSRFQSPTQIHESIMQSVTPATKLVVLSQITSPTAIRLPVESLCEALSQRSIATCIDGPHAVIQETLRLEKLGCDFFTASCHKWLCAPIGSGFVYIAPKWHDLAQPTRLSWGRLPPLAPEHWTEEFTWTGTRDYSSFLTVKTAFEFADELGREHIDRRNHALACYARNKLAEIPGAEPVTPEGREWFGWLVGVWLPRFESQSAVDEVEVFYHDLQKVLRERYGIEVMIVHFGNRYLVRISCHLYNTTHDIDFLQKSIVREMQMAGLVS